VSEKLLQAERLLDDFFSTYDPYLYLIDDASDTLRRLSKIKSQVDAATLRTARRLEKANAHKEAGYKNAGNWLGDITGESAGQAAASLRDARSIEGHPEVEEAFNSGRLSGPQARMIANAANSSPGDAADLVDKAKELDFSNLQKECDKVRAAANSREDEIERYERIRRNRLLRTWTDADGAGRVEGKMTPDALGILKASLDPIMRQILEDERKSGRNESTQAYMADALVEMAYRSAARSQAGPDSDGRGSACSHSNCSDPGCSDSGGPEEGTPESGSADSAGPRVLVRIRADLGALLRGHLVSGETCSIPGIDSDLPVALVRGLITDALLELVITNGTDVRTVVSDSRYIARALRIALEERDPECCVAGCNESDHLEIDHWQKDFIKGGETSLENLVRLCQGHHRLKTSKGWRLEGGHGRWKFISPDGTVRREAGSGRANAPPEQTSFL
jgi:Domain of unknown function (DUF222)